MHLSQSELEALLKVRDRKKYLTVTVRLRGKDRGFAEFSSSWFLRTDEAKQRGIKFALESLANPLDWKVDAVAVRRLQAPRNI